MGFFWLKTFCVTLSLLIFLFVCAPATLAEKGNDAPFSLGLNIVAPYENYEPLFKQAKRLGITHIRTDWRWDRVETVKGQYDWSSLDRLVKLARQYDFTLLPIVHYAPSWAVVEGRKPKGVYEMAPRADAYDDYARFLAASIDRYGPDGNAHVDFKPIKTWQVWNEPNHKDFWGPKEDARAFAGFMQVVHDGLGKQRRDKVQIMHAGLSKADTTFMWHLWKHNPQYHRLFDVFAVHPYFFDPKGGVRGVEDSGPSEKTSAQLGFLGQVNGDHGYLPQVFDVALFMRYQMEKDYGGKAFSQKSICVSEIGFLMKSSQHDRDPPWWYGNAASVQRGGALLKETLAYIHKRLTTKPFGQGVRGDVAAHVECVFLFGLMPAEFTGLAGDFNPVDAQGRLRQPIVEGIKPFLNVISQ